MKTYKITGRTNGYIASRDIHFNGKTEITITHGLTHEKAIETLENFFCKDYDSAILIELESEFIFERFFATIDEQASAIGIKIEYYYQQTAKRWKIYADNKLSKREKFDGAGYYDLGNYYGCLFQKGDESYNYDSRNYSIEEDTNENE